jgi:hypothetical protein
MKRIEAPFRPWRLGTLLGLIAVTAAGQPAANPAPLALHPVNPHYFLFRGQPAVLVTSGEHYGAVLNRDFDYVKYLATLAADGLNLTRVFSGLYVENPGAFKIVHNTLAPAPGRFLCPWARSEQPGYAGGGNKFDLARWDPAYFARLRDFMTHASRHGIVVEYVFFCPFYRHEQWQLSPLHPAANIGALTPEGADGNAIFTLDRHGGLLAVQEQLVRKVVAELGTFDNLYFEICNEPYARKLSAAWENHMAGVIDAARRDAGCRHLISRNVANANKGVIRVEAPHPAVSILNFHYVYPPENAVAVNYHLPLALGENETGFRGHGDEAYLVEGWEFLLAGGALYNNLDYSFAVGHEDGGLKVEGTTPGGGSATLRRQLGALRRFLQGFPLERMKPDPDLVVSASPAQAKVHALAEPGRQYALYASGEAVVTLRLRVPAGSYSAGWFGPRRGGMLKEENFDHSGGELALTSPPPEAGIALRLVRREGPARRR